MTHVEGSDLVSTRPIDHTTCTRGTSGAWYPNFGPGVEVFRWAHIHNTDTDEIPPFPPPPPPTTDGECCYSGWCEVCHPSMVDW
jgi:hypothetical protein